MFIELSLRGNGSTRPSTGAVVRTAKLGQDVTLEDRNLLSSVSITGLEWSAGKQSPFFTESFGIIGFSGPLVFTSQVEDPSGGFSVEGSVNWRGDGVSFGVELFRGTLSSAGILFVQGYEITGVSSTPLQLTSYIARLDMSGDMLRFVDGTWTDARGLTGTWGATANNISVGVPTLRVTDEEQDPFSSQQQTFRITTDALAVEMPRLTFELRNLPSGVVPSSLLVTWTTTVFYRSGPNSPPGAQEVPGFTFTVTRLGTQYQPTWPSIRGGDLDVTATFTFNGSTFTVSSEATADTRGLQILGSNPTKAQIQDFIDGFPVPDNWPANSGYEYHSILRKIAYHETNNIGDGGYNQFYRTGRFAGHPAWNTGGDRGVGVMQATPPNRRAPIVPANVWDWRANVAAGVTQLNFGLGVADRLPVSIRGVAFDAALARVQDDRQMAGLPPLAEVVVPALTPLQRVRVAIRAYNGAAGSDSLGRKILNEYELAATGPANAPRLALTVNETNRVGMAEWVLVPVTRRPAGVGQPNYVELVLAAPDT
jgi:hypothetical protein